MPVPWGSWPSATGCPAPPIRQRDQVAVFQPLVAAGRPGPASGTGTRPRGTGSRGTSIGGGGTDTPVRDQSVGFNGDGRAQPATGRVPDTAPPRQGHSPGPRDGDAVRTRRASIFKKKEQLKITLVAKTTTTGSRSLRDPPQPFTRLGQARRCRPGVPRDGGTASPSWRGEPGCGGGSVLPGLLYAEAPLPGEVLRLVIVGDEGADAVGAPCQPSPRRLLRRRHHLVLLGPRRVAAHHENVAIHWARRGEEGRVSGARVAWGPPSPGPPSPQPHSPGRPRR